ncbi:MAG: dihydroorotate dehydrogenase-like protein [Odoribacteraceae bacterium]|jgi:dihydroorotate dehydrogenase (fumarate)|nr:dihydroorotate dehydrogenase-like protein [Odoribacteraceae bacterium]
MADLRVKFMGMELRSPVVVASCGLTSRVEGMEVAERSGAGAVVMKSIFEEQIREDTLRAYRAGFGENDPFPGALDYLRAYARSHSIRQHVEVLREAKRRLTIPVIASINCFSDGEWVSFAKELEEAGADALELNIFIPPTGDFAGSADLEEAYAGIVRATRAVAGIPLAVKIGRDFTHLPAFVERLHHAGANAVTLFNRLVSPDIRVDTLEITGDASPLSQPSDLRATLRWTGVVAGRDRSREISASTGVHDGEAVVKLLLAGATSVQVCSLLYRRGVTVIKELNDFLATWMERNGFARVEEFRGMRSGATIADQRLYERAQFIKYFNNPS